MTEFPTFFAGKRVFLTGHNGFKGSWLATWLKVMGAEVTGFSLPCGADSQAIFAAAGVEDGMRSLAGDIMDADAVRRAMVDADPEMVIHNAAQALVRKSYAEPLGTFATNIMGTANVLDAMRSCKQIRSAVVVTTDKCYENREWTYSYREVDRLGGRDPYSASKACAELVTHSYRSSFLAQQGIAVATARAGNVIGGGDWAEDRLVPDIIRALQQGKPIILRNPQAQRPWQHVLEPVRGYLLLSKKLYEGGQGCAEAWNFGPPESSAVPVRQLTETILKVWGSGSYELDERPGDPHEAGVLKLDSSKAKARLGWTPLLSLEDSVRYTVEWYHAAWTDLPSCQKLSLAQIAGYEQLMSAQKSKPAWAK